MKRIKREDIFVDIDNVLNTESTVQVKVKKRSRLARLRSKVDIAAEEIKLKKEISEFLI